MAALVALIVVCLPPSTPQAAFADADLTPIFDAAYNLNYDAAMVLAETAVARHPESSAAHRAIATVIWMHLLFERGALTIDHYLGGMTQSDVALPAPPAERAARFRQHVDRAVALAEAELRRNPSNVQAKFDAGMAHGLSASWMATIDGRVRSALGAAKRAFDAHEWVLDREPQRHDAGLVVGTYRYSVAALSFAKRWLAYIAGFGGNKALGIALLEAAASSPTTATDARLALALVFSREGQHRKALDIFTALHRQYPENRLLQLEAGSSAWRAGLGAEAEALLTDGLAVYDRDRRAKFPGERAVWVYKRGMVRVSRNRLSEASADLQTALTLSPAGWVQGRIHLEQGRIADLRGERQRAVQLYRQAETLCRTNRDPWCADESGRYRRRPFTFAPARQSTVD
ncbi:MAG: tetratricopeptide repeat protein [Vicinamibacterales bacterium]